MEHLKRRVSEVSEKTTAQRTQVQGAFPGRRTSVRDCAQREPIPAASGPWRDDLRITITLKEPAMAEQAGRAAARVHVPTGRDAPMRRTRTGIIGGVARAVAGILIMSTDPPPWSVLPRVWKWRPEGSSAGNPLSGSIDDLRGSAPCTAHSPHTSGLSSGWQALIAAQL